MFEWARRRIDAELRVAAPLARPIAYRDGSSAGWAGGVMRVRAVLGQHDPKLVAMLILAEDRRFLRHFGVDLWAVARALVRDLKARTIVEGGSTINQQLLKNTLLRGAHPLPRKAAEFLLAPLLDAVLGKPTVLEHYLNTVYVGGGLYGMRTASLVFLGHDIDRLSWSEAALLAGLPAAPEAYAFHRPNALAFSRRRFLINLAVRSGVVSTREAQAALSEPLPQPRTLKSAYRDSSSRLEEMLGQSGVDPIVTTLDRDTQAAACRVARRVASASQFCALAMVDVETGEVAAATTEWVSPHVGHDVAWTPGMSPGSAVKPFALAAALASGWSTTDRLPSGSVVLETEETRWAVENWQGKSYGNPTLAEAMTLSDNTVYARLVLGIGHDRVARLMATCGLPALPSPGPTVTLGVLARGISPVELAASYSAFAEAGVVVAPRLVLGRTETRASPISQQVASSIRDVLHVYVARYLSDDLHGAWGKTGTPDDGRVGWFVGVRGRFATAVAIGGGGSRGPAKAYEAALAWERLQEELQAMRKLAR